MSKIGLVAGVILASAATTVHAGGLGPDAAVCASGGGPAILVRVEGLKDRSGPVRVRTFGGDPSSYFDKTRALARVVIDTPPAGPVEICMPVPGPGTYAVDVRHDVNRDGKTNKADGAGASGNPNVSLFDIVFGRKPSPAKVAVQVGRGVVVVNVTMKYLQGGALKPIASALR